jgi:glutathione synthase/RimK-type ligase-like ATP-grasp enzyme
MESNGENVLMLYIYPYKFYSESARKLRAALPHTKFVRPDGRFRPRRTDLVINWGNTHVPNWRFDSRCDLNNPDNVRIAACKLATFNKLEENHVPTPRFTTSRETATTWLDSGSTILCRTLLNSHSGRGIIVVQPDNTLQDAPLYVEYKKKRAEYRVHVFGGEVIDECHKRKRNSEERPENFNTFIRSYNNGWVFCRDGLLPDPNRSRIAIEAVSALGLDFGAVDMIYNEREQQYYVLEVNTAPGLEGTTLTKYLDVFRRLQ